MRHIRLLMAAVFIAVTALGILLLPSAPGERAAEAAVQQPYQCPPVAYWDLFNGHWFARFDSQGVAHVFPIKAINDTAPRNERGHIHGASGLGLNAPAPGVLDNDDFGSPPGVRLVQSPSHAKDFSLNPDGSYVYVPVDGYLGGDSFTYAFIDNVGACFGAPATVTIPAVSGRLLDDSYSVRNDQVFNSPLICSLNGCGFLYNDISSGAAETIWVHVPPTGHRLASVGQTLPINGGSVRLNHESGGFSFTPAAGFVGTTAFYYYTTNDDDLGLYSDGPTDFGDPTNPADDRHPLSAKVSLNVVAPPAVVPGYKPLALDDSYTTNEDTPLSFAPNAFVQNDVGASYGGIQPGSGPAHGTVEHDVCTFSEWQLFQCTQIGALQAIIYRPHANYHGLDSFKYQAIGDQSGTVAQVDIATVNIVINPVRDQPVLQSDTFAVKRGEPTVLDVLANDADPDGLIDRERLFRGAGTGDDAGTLELLGDDFMYTADGSALQMVFSYAVWTLEDPAVQLNPTTFTVNVDPNPAADDSYTTNEDTPLTRTAAQGVLANDVLGTGTVSPTGVIRTTELGAVDLNADGSFSYTPPANFSGTDTFGYVHNGDGATVTITVNSVPDAPALVLNIAECPEGLICVDRPDPDNRVDLGPGDQARLRGLISDAEHDSGTIEIDWGDGEKTTRGYPCGFAEVLCPFKLAQNQTWYPASLGNCGPGSCNDAAFFDFGHVYDGQPPADGLRYNITVKVTSLEENLTGQANTYATLADGDGDGIGEAVDNCPGVANPDRLDTDADGLGDACDADDDNDTVLDEEDNCPVTFNDDQTNTDGDGYGDACDLDDDNDGVDDFDDPFYGSDNCQFVPNIDQANNDGDSRGDACDVDDDNDTVVDSSDNCQFAPNMDQSDTDGDGLGDVCDEDDDGDGLTDGDDNCPSVANSDQTDTDHDGAGDACDEDDDNDGAGDGDDNCGLVANADQADFDFDGEGDACDADDDGDGAEDTVDNCLFFQNPDQADADFDGEGDACDADDDGDGWPDLVDNCPLAWNFFQEDNDLDGAGDACDDDDDDDGDLDVDDNCALTPNPDQADLDLDGEGDACDPDDDADGVLDTADNCPLAENSDQDDNDADALGDACDPDDDNDGVGDSTDNCQFVANGDQANNDGDAQGDSCDDDDDNDGDLDGADNCQFVANASQANFDGDALGDACDANDDNDALPDGDDACDLEVPQGGLDADGNGCTDTIARLRALVSSLNISKGTKSGLLGYLGEAQKLYDRGKILQAENKLGEFIVQVEAKRGKGLTNADANLLVAYANNIIANI